MSSLQTPNWPSLSEPSLREVVLMGLNEPKERRRMANAVSFLRKALNSDVVHFTRQAALPEAVLLLPHWQCERASLPGFDRLFRRLDQAGPFRLVLSTRNWLTGAQSALEILNRYQRLLPLPELSGASDSLRDALHAEALLGASVRKLTVPGLERVDTDTWRWLLRLRADPPPAVQLAALLGDTTTSRATELACPAPLANAVGEAWPKVLELLDGVASSSTTDPDVCLLEEARELSFFAQSGWSYFHHLGGALTFQRLERMFNRLSDQGVCLALGTRQPAEVSRMLEVLLEARQGRSHTQVGLMAR